MVARSRRADGARPAGRLALSGARRNPLRQVAALRARLAGIAAVAGQTRDHVHGISATLQAHGGELAQLATQLNALEQRIGAESERSADRQARLESMLRVVFSEERHMRQRLWEARAEPGYELAYTDTDPLVSVVIPTYDNYRLLGERSLPSVLAQTHQNFEVVVVGDQAPVEAADIVASFGDARLTFHNLNRRGPYPSDQKAFWHVAGIPPFNEAVRRARGRWIAPLGDDDAFRPHHIEALLDLARDERQEATYGKFVAHFLGGRPAETVGVFPPAYGHFGVQVLLYHSALRFFEMELADELFSLPGDWSLAERMLRCGVRFGMVDDVVTDYYPSWSWTPRGPT